MKTADHFRLGMDLEAGTTQAEGERGDSGHPHLRIVDHGQAAALLDTNREDHFIARDGAVFAGTHLIIEVVDGRGLDEEARVRGALEACVEACGATLLHLHTHRFTPQGISGVAVLAESHISVHTWPEIGYGAFDVFMCGDARPWEAVEVLRHAFAAGDVQVRELRRGEGIVADRL
ncbi:MAG: adenosylmethionine decarboxylase [Pseudomonadota bacterium]